MGASSFVVSRRAFQGLTEAAAGDCALFLLPQLEQGQRKEWLSERQKSWLRKDCAETAIGSRKENASAPAYGRSRTT